MNKLLRVALLVGLFFLGASHWPVDAGMKPEAEYRDLWCEEVGGKAEVRLPDGTWADCLTLGYAIEVDFAHKWYEAVGQALHYALTTGKLPGILLIVETPADCRKLTALENAIEKIRYEHRGHTTKISFWTIGPAAC